MALHLAYGPHKVPDEPYYYDLVKRRSWPVGSVVRCGASNNGKACGRAVGLEILLTSDGPILVGEERPQQDWDRPRRDDEEGGERGHYVGHVLATPVMALADAEDWWWTHCDRHPTILLAWDVMVGAAHRRGDGKPKKAIITRQFMQPDPDHPPICEWP